MEGQGHKSVVTVIGFFIYWPADSTNIYGDKKQTNKQTQDKKQDKKETTTTNLIEIKNWSKGRNKTRTELVYTTDDDDVISVRCGAGSRQHTSLSALPI